MAESNRLSSESHLTWIEPDDRLVVVARTMQAQDLGSETAWIDEANDRARLGTACLGRSLYRHCSIFQSASDAPVWSHLELTYFRDVVSLDALQDLVFQQQSARPTLLRAEILLTTPSAFVMPRSWKGSAARPDRQVSVEYIDVKQPYLDRYRDLMRTYIGPAAARLVERDKIGTFRAMETVAVLYRDPALGTDWNQIHLCEVSADGFRGFGQEFDAELREMSPDGGFSDVFAGLDRMRSIPRWTFNEPVVENDIGVRRRSLQEPLP